MAYIKNWFSNMLPMDTPLVYQDIEYKTVENYYQAMKLCEDDIEGRKQIAALTPHKSKTEIRNKGKYVIRPDWNRAFKLQVMETALRHKFAYGTTWANRLLQTEEPIIEFNNWNDLFWGQDVDTKEGENHLGKILMKIKKELVLRDWFEPIKEETPSVS